MNPAFVDVSPPPGIWAFKFDTVLGDQVFTFRFAWERTSSLWFYTVHADDENIARGLAKPGEAVTFTGPPDTTPPGQLDWVGKSTSAPTDLGETLKLLWRPA